MRNVPSSQPVDDPVANAAEARANSARATVHAPWYGALLRDQRTAVAWANTVATAVAMKARPATMSLQSVTAGGADPAVAYFENPLTRSVPWASMADSASRRIPEATVARLPLYYRALLETAEHQVATISSERLAELAGVNAAKVRKDLSYLGSYGTRGVGYEVEYLLHEISRELGLTRDWPVVIVGIGNLRRALANYRGFGARGFRVMALVDTDPEIVGQVVAGQKVEPISNLRRIVKDRQVAIGILATPAAVAQEVADALVAAGVRSILNFAPAVLTVPDAVSMRKVDLAIELQILSFYQLRRGQPIGVYP